MHEIYGKELRRDISMLLPQAFIAREVPATRFLHQYYMHGQAKPFEFLNKLIFDFLFSLIVLKKRKKISLLSWFLSKRVHYLFDFSFITFPYVSNRAERLVFPSFTLFGVHGFGGGLCLQQRKKICIPIIFLLWSPRLCLRDLRLNSPSPSTFATFCPLFRLKLVSSQIMYEPCMLSFSFMELKIFSRPRYFRA